MIKRIYHTAWRKYGDVLSIDMKNEWVTVLFDGDKGTQCYELDSPYIKKVNNG